MSNKIPTYDEEKRKYFNKIEPWVFFPIGIFIFSFIMFFI